MDGFALLILITCAAYVWAQRFDWSEHQERVLQFCKFLPASAAKSVTTFLFKKRIEPWRFAGLTEFDQVLRYERIWGSPPDGRQNLRDWGDKLHRLGVNNDEMTEWREFTSDLRVPIEWADKRFYALTDSLPWINSTPPFTPAEAHEWDACGFDAAEATEWRSLRFTPRDASLWSEEKRVSPMAADVWRSFGGESGYVGAWWSTEFRSNLPAAWQWHKEGAGPEEALVWGSDFTPHEARQWDETGFSPDPGELDAHAWKRAVATPENAVRWFSAGISSSAAADWSVFSAPLIALHWINAGFTAAPEAKALIDAGCTPEEALIWTRHHGIAAPDVGTWKRAGVSHDLYLGWFTNGFDSPTDVLGWTNLGITPSEAAQWRQITSPHVAREWLNFGINFLVARPWIQRGIRTDVASEWIQVGIEEPDEVDVFARAGISPHEFHRWRACGIQPNEIARTRRFWTIDNFETWNHVNAPEELKRQWSLLGNPDQVRNLLELGIEQESIAAWLSSEIPTEQLKDWLVVTHDDAAVATRWWKSGSSPTEAGKWIGIGITDPTAVEEWLDLGLSFDETQVWSVNNGLSMSATEAQTWLVANFKSNAAWEWVQSGFRTESSARQWLDEGFEPVSARDWLAAETAENAKRWSQHGFTPDSASPWIVRRFSVDDALEWRAVGVADAVDALLLRDNQVPISETIEWLELGLIPAEFVVEREHWTPGDFARWTQLSFPRVRLRLWHASTNFDFVRALCDFSCTEIEIQTWIDSGLDVDQALPWLKQGIRDASVSHKWDAIGFNASLALPWIELQVEPDLARYMSDLNLGVDLAPLASIIHLEEEVDYPTAVWRASLTSAGIDRIGDIPAFTPPHGCCDEDTLRIFLHTTMLGGADIVAVRHMAPHLSKQMLEAVPLARPVRGSVKKHLFGLDEVSMGRMQLSDDTTDPDVIHVKFKGVDSRRPFFSIAEAT